MAILWAAATAKRSPRPGRWPRPGARLMPGRDMLTIGELSARSGVAPSALRYYERLGLIQATRTSGNQRRYEKAQLRRVAFIRIAATVGLTLEEIRHSAGVIAEVPHAHQGGLGAAVPPVAAAPGRPDRPAGAASGLSRRLHRMRLPLPQGVPALQPRRRARGRGPRTAAPAPTSLTAAAVASAAAGQVDSSADGGSRRILPTCSLDSINLWASAAWVIGSRRSTTGRIRPCPPRATPARVPLARSGPCPPANGCAAWSR